MDVDPVQQRSGDPPLVLADLQGRAAAGAAPVAEVTAGAAVSRCSLGVTPSSYGFEVKEIDALVKSRSTKVNIFKLPLDNGLEIRITVPVDREGMTA